MVDKNLYLEELKEYFPDISDKIEKNFPIDKIEFLISLPTILKYETDDNLERIATEVGVNFETRIEIVKEEEDKKFTKKVYLIKNDVLQQLNKINQEKPNFAYKFDKITNEIINLKKLYLQENNANESSAIIFLSDLIDNILQTAFLNKSAKNIQELEEIFKLNPILFKKEEKFESFIEEFKQDIRDYVDIIIINNKMYFLYPLKVENYSRVLPIVINLDGNYAFTILEKNTLLGFNVSNFRSYSIKI